MPLWVGSLTEAGERGPSAMGGGQLGERSLLGRWALPELGAGWAAQGAHTEGCSCNGSCSCFLAAFRPLVQVFHLLLLQTLWEESEMEHSGPGAGHPWVERVIGPR